MENQVEMEEKTRLINQVLELQHTLEGNASHTHTHIADTHIYGYCIFTRVRNCSR